MCALGEGKLLAGLCDSWQRNNDILINLLRALPEAGLEAAATPTSPTVVKMFAHMIYVRFIFVSEVSPDYADPHPPRAWLKETDPERIAAGLKSSAHAVWSVVDSHLRSGKPLEMHYDHPLLLMQHMIWHEGYHHGQIKLALKIAGLPFDDEQIGPVTWDVWMGKDTAAQRKRGPQ
jgi:uncharacterized damage-inducible protein DinB